MTDFGMPRLIDVSGVVACCGVALSTTLFFNSCDRGSRIDANTHTHTSTPLQLPLKMVTRETGIPSLPRGGAEGEGDLLVPQTGPDPFHCIGCNRSRERQTSAQDGPFGPSTPRTQEVSTPHGEEQKRTFLHNTPNDSGLTSNVYFFILLAQSCCLL